MHIAISTLVSPPQPNGVGNYLRSLVSALQELKTTHRFTLFITPETEHLFPVTNPAFSRVTLPLKHDPRPIMRPLYFLWQNTLFNRWARLNNADLLHIPNLVPVWNLAIPYVMTIHDLSEFHLVRYRSKMRQAYRQRIIRHCAKDANALITVSEHAKNDIIDICGISPDKITVTYEALTVNCASAKPDNSIFTNLGITPGKYFLYVGNDMPHKQLPILVEAFESIHSILPEQKLVLSGSINRTALFKNLSIKASKSILTPGYLSTEAILALYREATAFVFPSQYEGFGLPLLEAMANGCPVICTRTSCLPEVCADAACYASSPHPENFAQEMTRLAIQPELRTRLYETGLQRVKDFSWDKCAKQTVAVYQRVFATQQQNCMHTN